MVRLLGALFRDEAGFVISSELILVGTIVVLSLVVGLSELSIGINEELEDVGSAVAAMNQSFGYCGVTGHKGFKVGSGFGDYMDHCDSQFDINCNAPAVPEAPKSHYGY